MRLFPSGLLLALVAAVGFAPVGAQTPRPSALGSLQGVWEMPSAIPEGLLLGRLPGIPHGAPPLVLQALIQSPTPLACPGCIEGVVLGTLDDGVGPGPDYLVEGRYQGQVLSGRALGTFRLALRRADGRRAGWMLGRFEDPEAAGPGGGSFRARYLIRDGS